MKKKLSISFDDKTKKKIYTYDTLRIITTLLVILSHCSYYNIITKYGGINYGELLSSNYNDTLIHSLFSKLVSFIYTFHMPLFICLSGALFYIQIKENRFANINALLVNKIKRLMIPFFVVNVFYSIPIKYISGYFSNSSNIIKDILVGQIFIQGNTYLWFLPTLLMCFILIYLIEKHINIGIGYKFIIFLSFNILSVKMPINIIKYIFTYIFWFYIGYLFESIREEVDMKIKNYKGLWIFILIGIIFLYGVNEFELLGNSLIYKFIYKLILISVGILSCFLVYIFSFKISKIKIINNKKYKELLTTSFGLYLYSDPVNYLILFIIYQSMGLEFFSTEIGSFIIILLRIISSFVVAFTITKLLKKLNVKYIV